MYRVTRRKLIRRNNKEIRKRKNILPAALNIFLFFIEYDKSIMNKSCLNH